MFNSVITNHDGEASDNRKVPIPEDSDAYLVIKKFSTLINDM